MNKTPSALKWLAEKRARIANDVLQTEVVVQDLLRHQRELQAQLDALDVTLRLYDPNLSPSRIEPALQLVAAGRRRALPQESQPGRRDRRTHQHSHRRVHQRPAHAQDGCGRCVADGKRVPYLVYANDALELRMSAKALGLRMYVSAFFFGTWSAVDAFDFRQEAAERDELKNTLFKRAGLPLVRIRTDDEKAVRAEDFYDLSMAESKTLDALRPHRLRPRRTHDFLVPAESAMRCSRWSRTMVISTRLRTWRVRLKETEPQ